MTTKTVLLGEDDLDLSNVLAVRLKQLGLAPLIVPDATHALLGVHRSRPDLIIMDVDLPSGNGLAVCEMLSFDERCADIPVIVHTGLQNKETIKRCKHLGAYYVQKSPDSWEQISLLVGVLLDTGSELPDTDSEPPDAGDELLASDDELLDSGDSPIAMGNSSGADR